MEEKIIGPDYKSLKNNYVSKNIIDNENFLKNIFSKSDDLQFKKLRCGRDDTEVLLVYMEYMVRREIIENYVLTPLMSIWENNREDNIIEIDNLKNTILKVLEADEANTFDKLILNLLSGSTLIFLEGSDKTLIIKSEDKKERSLETPESEQTIRGSRVAFTENIKTNIALIRSQIKDPNLAMEMIKLGKREQKDVAIMYIRGVISNELPSAIIDKIQKLDIDGIMDAGQLEQLIEKNKWTVLPQMITTERLDRVTGNLIEGRAVIILDGTPFVLVLPTTLKMFLSSPDDYFQRPIVVSTLLRFIRYLGLFIDTSLAPLYIALTVYQPGMIPTPLALSITGSRLGLPFPMIIEVLVMEATLYTLQEAAIRLPKPMGTTVGVVGGLVIGQSVVTAGIISPIIVIIISGSAISSFALPNYTFSLGCTVIRGFLIIMSSILGLYGVVMGWIILTVHLASLDNFGIRYLSDYSPYNAANFKDSIIRVSESFIKKRPSNLNLEDDIKNNSGKVDDKTNDEW